MRCIKITGCSMFVVFSLLLVSCTNDFDLAPLDIAVLKEQFPYELYVNADKVVFKNETNNDLVFDIEHLTATITTIDEQGFPYKSDRENFILTQANPVNIGEDLCDELTNFRIHLTSSYVNEEPVKEIKIFQSGEYYRKFSLTLDSLGSAINGSAASISILTETYDAVSTSTNNWTEEVDPGFYYNKTDGLIGFIDENDVLWVFDRFE